MKKRRGHLFLREILVSGDFMNKVYSDFEMRFVSFCDSHKEHLNKLAMYDDTMLQAIALTFKKNSEDIKNGLIKMQ